MGLKPRQKIIDISTKAGIDEAERLILSGWILVDYGLTYYVLQKPEA